MNRGNDMVKNSVLLSPLSLSAAAAAVCDVDPRRLTRKKGF